MTHIDIKRAKEIIEKSKKQIENYTAMGKQLALKIQNYEQEIKQMPDEKQKLTANNLLKLGEKPIGDFRGGGVDDDSMSEVMTERTAMADLGPTENILDLTVFEIEYDQQIIAKQILNMDHPMESAV